MSKRSLATPDRSPDGAAVADGPTGWLVGIAVLVALVYGTAALTGIATPLVIAGLVGLGWLAAVGAVGARAIASARAEPKEGGADPETDPLPGSEAEATAPIRPGGPDAAGRQSDDADEERGGIEGDGGPDTDGAEPAEPPRRE